MGTGASWTSSRDTTPGVVVPLNAFGQAGWAAHMASPSQARATPPLLRNTSRTAPSRASRASVDTQIVSPSKPRGMGAPLTYPISMVASTVPSRAILVTVESPRLATQTLSPSKRMDWGIEPVV